MASVISVYPLFFTTTTTTSTTACGPLAVGHQRSRAHACLVLSSYSSSSPAHNSSSSSHSHIHGLPKKKQERFFATCPSGMEEVVAAELKAAPICAEEVKVGASGVSFSGSLETGFRANLWLRCAVRVLLLIASGPLPRRSSQLGPIYTFVRSAADWPHFLTSSNPHDSPRSGDAGGAHRYGHNSYSHDDRYGDNYGDRYGDSYDNSYDDRRGDRYSNRYDGLMRTFSVQSRVYNCQLVDSSLHACVRAKDAICDSIRDACGVKPQPPHHSEEDEGEGRPEADIPLFLSLYKDYANLYRDMSGMSLHMRGYRDIMHRASLNEAVAAGMLTIAGWNSNLPGFGTRNKNSNNNASLNGSEERVLLDPMCGSGSLLIEAALMATNRAPGLLRSRWPFERWHDFDSELWRDCRKMAFSAGVDLPKGVQILGNDIHEGALSLCLKNAKAAGVDDILQISCEDCKDYIPTSAPSLVVVNPPWGFRLGEDSYETTDSWRSLSQLLKQHCNCADVYLLCGNSDMTRFLRMKADKKWPITIGGIESRLLHYYVLPKLQKDDSPVLSEVQKA